MASFKRLTQVMLSGASFAALAACGASDIASPGTGGNVTINNVTPAPTPTPTPTPTTVAAASGCPTILDPQGLTDSGTISGPTGSYRVCTLPSVIRTSITLPKITGLVYAMNGRVNVGCDGGFTAPTAAAPVTSTTVGCTTPLTADTNVTLTINPGVILFGNTGQSWLAVNRGNKISAIGTAAAPIVFTSRDNILGLNDDTSQGQWGGVVLLGRGVTTDCNVGSVASNTCERDTEGAADLARFGGTNNAYDAGRMSYVQIRYSGFVLGANRELQALTTEAIGTGTTLDHIQSHNSSDDGAEFFGGGVNLKYYIATGADDDSLDVDTGAQMNVQYALLLPRSGRGDALFEIDSNGLETDTPRTRLNVVNWTAIQPVASADNEANDLAAGLFRGNSDTTLANGILLSPNNECIRMNGSGATPATLAARSVVLQCNATKYLGSGTLTAAQVAAAFATGTNFNSDAFTPSLTSVFINGANETAVTGFNATALSTFFDATTWIGAVRNSTDTWYAGWACNSATVNFGTGSTSCTSLPTT
ncbi:hypothetical protein [Sphingomonas sp. SUN039]|uniref:hypothetical protein n=1 Tax=Sphingomonas sp. SUN039 TaxID=2937787 RepID=UPI0021646155|nr:hypothetical protein [Sphingomonas sp. SUN039]UVO53924.1 hypothetical protein M0209_07235 [Sphingomonas sp. SUN039]